jgi:hypothetical protein
MIDVTAWAPPRFANEGDYGVGRRPALADLRPVDPQALAEWQARQDRAAVEYGVCPSIAERYMHNTTSAS